MSVKSTIKKTAAVILAVSLGMTSFMAGGKIYADEKNKSSASDFKESKNIWIIGDSIASDHDIDEANEVQITGWGNVLQQLVPDDVTVINKARSGRSSKSYTTEQVYREVMKNIKEGDYVIIQFGHNDEKEAPRYTDPAGDSATEGSYKYYLKTKFIDPIYEKGGRVILASSVVRHLFDGEKLGEQTHGVYAKAMEELAEDCKSDGKEVYFIDTFSLTEGIYNRLGEVATEKLHAVIGKGADAKLDDTHYSPYGAVYMASLIGQQLKELGISCLSDTKKAWLIEDDSDKISKERAALDKFSFR